MDTSFPGTPFSCMQSLRHQLHQLIDRLPDANLLEVWPTLEGIYYDQYLLAAIDKTQRSLKPGDSLNPEEALQLLQNCRPQAAQVGRC